MFKNVLLAISSVDDARDAIALAEIVCGPDAQYTFTDYRGEYLFAEEDVRSAVCALPPHVPTPATVRASGDGLARLAAELDVDLIVLGSVELGADGAVMVPEWAEETLYAAECCVAVAPRGFAASPQTLSAQTLRRLGVGFNGTPESSHALDVARLLAAEHDAELEVLAAIPETGMYPLSAGVDDAGAGTDSIARQLHEFSADVDLLVLGPRDRSEAPGGARNSVSATQIHGARTPLLMVTRCSYEPDPPPRPSHERWVSATQ